MSYRSNIIGLTQKVVRNGREFVFYNYNSLGQANYVNAMGNSVAWETFDYHPDGTLEKVTNAVGYHATLTEYHRGQPQNIVQRDGSVFRRSVDDNGWVTSETNGRGYTTNYDYTEAGWIRLVDRPSPWADTIVSYHNLGSQDFYRSIVRGTKETVEWFDSMFRLRLVRENPISGGGVTSYIKTDYDALGRLTFTSLPSISSNPTKGTNTQFDGLGRVTQTRENYSPFVTTTTDYQPGNLMVVTDPLGFQTTTTRSGYGSPDDGETTLVEQPEDVNTAINYDIYGNPLTAEQRGNSNGYKSNIQTWSYDNRLRVCRHHVPETGSKLYEYDHANQVIRYSEGNPGTTGCAPVPSSNRVVQTYDGMGRIEFVDYSDTTPDVSIEYDENGNVESNSRGAAAWSYTYDSGDNLEAESLSVDGRTYALAYEYHPMGHMISRTLPSGRELTYNHDGLGRTNSITSDGFSYANGIGYHVNGVIADMTYGNGQVFSQTLDNRQLPKRLTFQRGSTKVMDLEYKYSPRTNVTEIVDWADRNRDRNMTYDQIGRLKTASGIWGAGTFDYDSLGNLFQKKLGSRTVGIHYDSNNRADESTDTTGSTRAIGYDDRGNVTTLGSLSFVYDMANQPVQPSGEASGNYTYDGNFKRVKVDVDNKLIYNVFDAAGRLVHIDEVTGGASLRVCLSSCDDVDIPRPTDYVRVNGMTIARLENDDPTYLHPDLLGSPVVATNAQGGLEWEEVYTPYGEKWLRDTANDDQMSFTGHIADSATGLTYMQARYYDPVIGRFLANDPVDFVGQLERGNSAGHGFNRYAYANNNPYTYTDPNGEFINFAVKFAADVALGVAIQVATGEDVNLGAALKESAAGILNPAKTVAKAAKLAKALKKGDGGGAAKKVEGTSGSGKCCFVAGTLVETEDGLRPIEEIKVGDRVLARSPESGETSLKIVTDLIDLHVRQIWKVSISDEQSNFEIFRTTDDHPWWVVAADGKGSWVATLDLSEGMLLTTADNQRVKVSSVTKTDIVDGTYNLTVADYETYFVGQSRVLVHNCKRTSVNQMQTKVERNQAPNGIKRFDKADANQPNSKDHVHFKDGTSCNCDGTPKDAGKGTPTPTNKEKRFLNKNGWKTPDQVDE